MKRYRVATARPWTVIERAQLRALAAAQRCDWDAIARHFPGRTASACKAQHQMLMRAEAGRPRDHSGERKVNGRIRHTDSDLRLMAAPPPLAPDHESITAAVFGDPPPGRSALDRRRDTYERGDLS